MEISARSGGRDPLDEPGWVVPIANSLVGTDRAAPAALAGAVAGAEAGSGPALSPRHSVRPLQRHSVATPAAGGGVRLGADMLAASGPVAGGRGLRPAAPGPARRAESSRRARQITGLRGRLPHPGKTWGCRHRPSPIDRRKTGSKHHLICDGRGRTSTTSPRPSPRSTASRRSRAAPDGLAAGPKPIGKVFVPPGRPLTRPASQTGSAHLRASGGEPSATSTASSIHTCSPRERGGPSTATGHRSARPLRADQDPGHTRTSRL